MGFIMSKTLEDNLKKQQKFMLESQKIQMERQIHMQNQMREKAMAMQIARSREMFLWLSSFVFIVGLGTIASYRHNKKRLVVVPLLPLSFLLAYQYDLAYGTKIHRIRSEADRILDDEQELIYLPHGVPSLSTIEAARQQQRDADRVQQSHDIFL